MDGCPLEPLAPPHDAVRAGASIDVVQQYLDAGGSVDAADSEGYTLLHYAASRGRLDIVELLLSRGANARARTKDAGSTPLHTAAWKGRTNVVIRLLEEPRVSVSDLALGAATPLHYASIRGHFDVSVVLLRYRADPQARDVMGETPLHFAASFGHLEITRCLLEGGALVNAVDHFGNTPLHQAAFKEFRDVVLLLLERGGDVFSRNQFEQTPREMADSLSMITLLREWEDLLGTTPSTPASVRMGPAFHYLAYPPPPPPDHVSLPQTPAPILTQLLLQRSQDCDTRPEGHGSDQIGEEEKGECVVCCPQQDDGAASRGIES